MFQILTTDKTYTLRTETEQELEYWVKGLQYRLWCSERESDILRSQLEKLIDHQKKIHKNIKKKVPEEKMDALEFKTAHRTKVPQFRKNLQSLDELDFDLDAEAVNTPLDLDDIDDDASGVMRRCASPWDADSQRSRPNTARRTRSGASSPTHTNGSSLSTFSSDADRNSGGELQVPCCSHSSDTNIQSPVLRGASAYAISPVNNGTEQVAPPSQPRELGAADSNWLTEDWDS